jgi:hypothetical protein
MAIDIAFVELRTSFHQYQRCVAVALGYRYALSAPVELLENARYLP